jgi:1,4-dihydroxy-2-naphthoate polyprenyltransferase
VDADSASRSPAQVWIEAARPRTLPAVISPVLVGTAAAQTFIAWRFAAALVVGLAVQVGVNYANDYYDGVRGVDTQERTGPRRAVAAGLVTPARMRAGMLAAFAVAGLAGLGLAAATTWWLVAVGAVSFLAAVGYSGGPRPYASAGLGEVFVFVFFGLVATVGSQFVQDEAASWLAVATAVPVGLLAVAILVVNNLRDIPTDREAGKATLAVRLGERRTMALFVGLVVGAFVLVPVLMPIAGSPWPLLGLAALPAARPALRGVRRATGPLDLVEPLAATARLHLAYGVLLAVGLAMAT